MTKGPCLESNGNTFVLKINDTKQPNKPRLALGQGSLTCQYPGKLQQANLWSRDIHSSQKSSFALLNSPKGKVTIKKKQSLSPLPNISEALQNGDDKQNIELLNAKNDFNFERSEMDVDVKLSNEIETQNQDIETETKEISNVSLTEIKIETKTIRESKLRDTTVKCVQSSVKEPKGKYTKGTWKVEEDKKLMELVNKLGPQNWTRIAEFTPLRSGKQCRERWHNHLNPNINKKKWSLQEDKILIEAHKK